MLSIVEETHFYRPHSTNKSRRDSMVTTNDSGKRNKCDILIELIRDNKYSKALKFIGRIKNPNELSTQILLDTLRGLPEIGDNLTCIGRLKGRINDILELKKKTPGVA